MRAALRTQAYVCLDCKLRISRHYGRRYQSSGAETQSTAHPVDLSVALPPNQDKNTDHAQKSERTPKKSQQSVSGRVKRPAASQYQASPATESKQDAPTAAKVQTEKLNESDEASLSQKEQKHLASIRRLRQRLKLGLAQATTQNKVVTGLSLKDAIKSMDVADQSLDSKMLQRMQNTFQKQHLSEVMRSIRLPKDAPRSLQRLVLRRLGLGTAEGWVSRRVAVEHKEGAAVSNGGGRKRRVAIHSVGRIKSMKASTPSTHVVTKPGIKSGILSEGGAKEAIQAVPINARLRGAPEPKLDHKRSIPKLDPSQIRTLSDTEAGLKPLPMETPSVPGLSFDLSRVLFNPGVYQLQDPRSRVFNFSPYLQRIMPVTEFNFDVLNEYITSSRDLDLRDLALEYQKKYLGSSSSMTGALTHFHFLLSAWRPVDVKTLSQGFKDPLRTFTTFQRGPAAIFLRWKDGIYAVDADKEYDSANILMSLGKSMEKLLTLPEEEFERYRKSAQEQGVELPKPVPEAYHYTESGDFLLRSQLDAYDSRLPGTGMFDLKTRAVVSIRMNVRQPEMGLGYEIRDRFGDMESYEREYFDMIRSAFLKYSLQVRMGRMDGIFVAYHNIERIFGFQYVSLPEMDLHLHGTEDRTTGDTEFRFSLALLNQIFDRVTAKIPETSLRFHFETRDSTGNEGCFMYIFAEAQSEADVENIQNSKKSEIAEFEKRILNTSEPEEDSSSLAGDHGDDSVKDAMDKPGSGPGINACDEETISALSDISSLSTAAEIKGDVAAKAEVFTQPPEGQLMGFILRIKNRINDVDYLRPEDLTKSDSWELQYTLEELPHDRALHHYTACRTRRAKLQQATQREDIAADYYLRRMKRLAESGRSMRKSMDKLDASRPVIVLDRAQQ